MRSLRYLLALGALAAPSLVPAPAEAQARVIITHERDARPAYSRRPVRRVVVAPRVIRVERIWTGDRRPLAPRWWARHGFRPVRVYVVDGRFYDRWHDRRGLREVTVYHRDGRYYRDWQLKGDRYDRRHDSRWEREHDRWHRDHDRDDRDWERDRDRDRDRGRDRDWWND